MLGSLPIQPTRISADLLPLPNLDLHRGTRLQTENKILCLEWNSLKKYHSILFKRLLFVCGGANLPLSYVDFCRLDVLSHGIKSRPFQSGCECLQHVLYGSGFLKRQTLCELQLGGFKERVIGDEFPDPADILRNQLQFAAKFKGHDAVFFICL